MWEINQEAEIQISELLGSKIYTIDNVFKYPKKLDRFLFNRQNFLVQGDPWSANGQQFLKYRYTDWIDKSCPVVAVAQKLCQQKVGNHGGFSTNVEAFVFGEFNDFQNNYWFPHLDNGYTLIVYFNEEQENGTNLYHPKLKEEAWFQRLMKNVPLGKDPWIPKKDVELVHTLKPAYNRAVLFDGAMFPHGSAIVNEQYYFDTHPSVRPQDMRKNLCFFFYPDDNDKKENTSSRHKSS